MRERLAKLGIPVLILATILVGCPLPFEFSGEGAGETERDPASPDVTAPVTIAFSESGGSSGTLAAGGTHISGVDTTITLSTETPNAVIYYTTSGGLTDLNAATRINASSGNFVVPRTTNLETRTITAIAVGPNMRPSPEISATVNVSPFPILTIVGTPAAISEDGGIGNFVISSNIAPTNDLAVSVTTDGDYSTAEVDFSGPAPTGWTGGLPGTTETITFPAGQTSISIPVTGKPTTANNSVTIGLTINTATGNDYSLTTQTRGQIVVTDNNTPILSMSMVGSTTIDDSTPNNTTIFRVNSTVAPTSDVTVNLQTSGDYQAGQVTGIPDANNPLSVTLLAGQQTVDIPITVTGDANGDINNETVTLTLQSDAQYVVETTSGAQTVTITDTSQTPVLSMGGADVTIDDGGTATATITVNTTVNPEIGLTIPLTFVGSLSVPPTLATFETGDFSIGGQAISPTGSDTYDLTFTANTSSASVTLYGIPDVDDADDETVIITIGSYTGGGYGWTVDATSANRVITITDPDHTITYDGNGSSGGAVPTDTNGYLAGSTVVVLGNTGNLVRSGFAFGGWNTQPDGTGTTYNNPYDPLSPSTFSIGSADTTLYARWIAAYTVSYDANDATSGTAPADQAKVQTINLTLATNSGTLQRTGHTFQGWNTQPDGSGVDYAAGATYFSDANLALYAKWEPDAPAIAVSAADQFTLASSSTTLVNPEPTFDVSSTGLTSATGLTFRLAVGTAPSTGVSHTADEEEVVVASGNAEAMSLPNSMVLALNSNETVYVRQRGTSTTWSPAASVNFTVDGYSWVGRVAPNAASVATVMSDTTTTFVDLRPLGAGAFHVLGGSPLAISSAVAKLIVGDTFIFDAAYQSRIFTVADGADVTLVGLDLRKGLAEGQAGGDTAGAGGGGGGAAGIGGAIYIKANATVAISNVTFSTNEARGGAGGDSPSNVESDGGAGGGPSAGAGGLSGTNSGGGNNADDGADATGDFSGGGGGGGVDGIGGAGSGGRGGYGGGGGGGGAPTCCSGGPGNGGIGGPAGGPFYGGNGGSATVGTSAGGGGGAGLGGAIFVEANATLTLGSGVQFLNGLATGGAGGVTGDPVQNGTTGQGRGAAVFVRSGGNMTGSATYTNNVSTTLGTENTEFRE